MITTIGIFSNQVDAENALDELRAGGIEAKEISYVYVTATNKLVDVPIEEKELPVSVGAALGFTVVNGRLPEFGELFAAGPLAQKLGFTGDSVSGGYIGVCRGFGIHSEDAKRFREYLLGGDILVVVCLKSSVPKDVFKKTHAREIQEYIHD